MHIIDQLTVFIDRRQTPEQMTEAIKNAVCFNRLPADHNYRRV